MTSALGQAAARARRRADIVEPGGGEGMMGALSRPRRTMKRYGHEKQLKTCG